LSVSRIKTITIAALVLVNVFFMTVIVIDSIADARSERLAVEDACAVLRLNGINISPENVRSVGALRTMRTERGHEAEEAIARAVLGPVEMTDMGVIFRYEGAQSGTAEFYSAGGFDIWLNEGIITNTKGTLRTVQSLLRDMKIETSELLLSGESGSEVVIAVVAYKGVSIFNCMIEFAFNGESLEAITGRYATGIEVAEDGATISSAGTALLGVLAAVKREELESTEIKRVEAGYQFLSGLFGEGVIAPAWLITTDTGQYMLSDTTGDIEFVQ